jgi:2-hydroxychromene-2-carboxylate isomerase
LKPAVVDYYFTPQSPWAYLGHARFMALLGRHGATAIVKPVNLNRVFAVSGGLPLLQRPAQRQAYRLIELERFRRHLNVPLNLHPRHFPVVPDQASCLLIAVDQRHGAEQAMALQSAIGAAVWSEEKNIADTPTLIELANQQELDGAALVEAATDASVMRRYDELTDEAIARGVFGAPTYVLDGEPFWGQDRLALLEEAMLRRRGAP